MHNESLCALNYLQSNNSKRVQLAVGAQWGPAHQVYSWQSKQRVNYPAQPTSNVSHALLFVCLCVGRVVWPALFKPGVVVWLGGVEKGARGDDESSVQLFNNWRNSSALQNSLTAKHRNKKKNTFSKYKFIPNALQKFVGVIFLGTRSRWRVCPPWSRPAAGWGCARLSPAACGRSSGAAGRWGQLEKHQETPGKVHTWPREEQKAHVWGNAGKQRGGLFICFCVTHIC